MDEFDFLNDNNIEDGGYSLEAILAEYQEETQNAASAEAESTAERITMEALAETIAAAKLSSVEETPESPESSEPPEGEAPEAEPAPPRRAMPKPAAIPVAKRTPQADIPAPPLPLEDEAEETPDEDFFFTDREETGYADAEIPPFTEEPENDASRFALFHKSGDWNDRLQALLLRLSALRKKRKKARPQAEAPDFVPGISPKSAAKIYSAQAAPFRLRSMAALAITLILAYIAFGYSMKLPLLGLMKDPAVASVVCLILLLAVMLLGLDVFTNGLLSLARKKPSAETLVSVSCLVSAVDAVFLALTGNSDLGLPFCAVAAGSLTCAIFSCRIGCTAYRISFRTAAQSSAPYTITTEPEVIDSRFAVMKSQKTLEGFVSKSEYADISESAWKTVAPLLLVACPVLALLASLTAGRLDSFFHCLAALFAVCASFSALLAFSLPYSLTARRLTGSGVALGGWAGASEICEAKNLIVTDAELFPRGGLTVAGVRTIGDTSPTQIISITGSILSASGSGLGTAFADLMRRQGCIYQHIDCFECHDGGGLSAVVHGQKVLVGTSGFMQLMGVRLAAGDHPMDAVYTAVGGSLAAVFTMSYFPVQSVQTALFALMNKSFTPLFAIRDFNITPAMLKQKFRLSTDKFEFLSFTERYRISGLKPEEDSIPCAVLTREGLGPLVAACIAARKLCTATLLGTALSLLGTIVGLLLLFFLCVSGAFDSASCGNLLLCMFLWLIPEFLIAGGLKR